MARSSTSFNLKKKSLQAGGGEARRKGRSPKGTLDSRRGRRPPSPPTPTGGPGRTRCSAFAAERRPAPRVAAGSERPRAGMTRHCRQRWPYQRRRTPAPPWCRGPRAWARGAPGKALRGSGGAATRKRIKTRHPSAHHCLTSDLAQINICGDRTLGHDAHFGCIDTPHNSPARSSRVTGHTHRHHAPTHVWRAP